MRENRLRRMVTIPRIVFTGLYTAFGTAAIFFLFRCAGLLFGLFSDSEHVRAVLSQLSSARILVPFWLLLLAALAACAVWAFFVKSAKNKPVAVLAATGTVLLLLAAFAAALLLTTINNVPVHTELKIVLALLKSDDLS